LRDTASLLAGAAGIQRYDLRCSPRLVPLRRGLGRVQEGAINAQRINWFTARPRLGHHNTEMTAVFCIDA
jgi:hypothetical protein